MTEGDVVIVALRQADGKIKNRPALLLRIFPLPYQDCLLCGISTQLNQCINNFDEIIGRSDTDFVSSGVITESLIRLSFLAAVPQKQIIGTIGVLSKERHERLLKKLSQYITANVD